MVTLIRGRHSQFAYVHAIMIPYDICPRMPWILLTQHTVHSPTKWDAKTVCIAIVQEWISQTIGRLHTVKPTLIPMSTLFVLLNPFCWLFLECHRNSVFLFGIGTSLGNGSYYTTTITTTTTTLTTTTTTTTTASTSTTTPTITTSTRTGESHGSSSAIEQRQLTDMTWQYLQKNMARRQQCIGKCSYT